MQIKENSKLKQTRKRRFLEKFRRDTKGATAVEFAILGLPFSALLFGIIEISVVFLLSTNTEHALSEVAREIRTGEFQGSSGNAATLKTNICSAMSGLGNCDKLRVDVVRAANGQFKELALDPSPEPCTGDVDEIEACEGAAPVMPADTYAVSGSEDVVIVRVQYVHQLTIPSSLTGLSNSTGNTRVITATTAFRNEPF